MMRYFVFYNDDYADNGGIGFEAFASEADALKFIEQRLSEHSNTGLDAYRLVAGCEVNIEAAETVTRVRVKS